MPTLHKSRWTITDPTSGRRRETRYLMTEAEARELDPCAEPVPGTAVALNIPDRPLYSMSTSSWQQDAVLPSSE